MPQELFPPLAAPMLLGPGRTEPTRYLGLSQRGAPGRLLEEAVTLMSDHSWQPWPRAGPKSSLAEESGPRKQPLPTSGPPPRTFPLQHVGRWRLEKADCLPVGPPLSAGCSAPSR